MNAAVQALFAVPDARLALRTVRRGSPADTLWEMESNVGRMPVKLDVLPRAFYGQTQEDAGEFLQELLDRDRSPVVSEIFKMEK
eukprot:5519239-Pyramimonas_sp.AAC.1